MRKIIIIAVASCTALLLLGYTGYRGYRVWKEHHWMNLAQDFVAKSDGRSAYLSLQQVLRFNPRNLEACRLMADLAEASRSPGALVWRNRALELSPDSLEDRLALVKTALAYGDIAVATNAIAEVSPAGKQTAEYHNLAGTLAIAAGQFQPAQVHFNEAIRLEPWNAVPKLNLAIVRLYSTNALDLEEARVALKRISASSTNLNLRCQALRELVGDALRHKQANAALAHSADLLKQTNSVFRDRLIRLDVLKQFEAPELKTAVPAFQREAAGQVGKVTEMATWQMTRTGPRDALNWLQTLPVTDQTNQAVALLMAECRTQLKDWAGLQAALEKQDWAELEFMRHAFLTCALREQNLAAAAKAAWNQCRQAAGAKKVSLAMLLQLTSKWRWSSETEEILWTIVKSYPDDQQSFRVLAQTLYASGRTRPLMNLYELGTKRQPADLGMKNNLAMTALLLNAQELKPHDLAREVFQREPTNAAYASTYAYSLYVEGKPAEALKIFQSLKPEALEHPSIAGYYGLILKTTGTPEKAQAYFNWATRGHLLPEERKIFAQN